jgi:hypothetical protein
MLVWSALPHLDLSLASFLFWPPCDLLKTGWGVTNIYHSMQCCQLAMTEILAKLSKLSIYFLSSVPTLPFVLMFFGAVAD